MANPAAIARTLTSVIREFVVAIRPTEMGNTLVACYTCTGPESQCEQPLCPTLLKFCLKSNPAI